VFVIKIILGLLFMPLVLIPLGWIAYEVGEYLGPIMIITPIVLACSWALGSLVLEFYNGR
jgi:hypothetical protein